MGYKRGDIVIVNLNPKKGDEVGKIRPAVVISGDDENEILDTVILVPLSTDLVDDMIPYRMRIVKRDKLKYDSDLLINQLRTLSKKRISEVIGVLTPNEYEEMIRYLCMNFKISSSDSSTRAISDAKEKKGIVSFSSKDEFFKDLGL